MLPSLPRRLALVSVASGLAVAGVALGSAPVGATPHHARAVPSAKLVTASLESVSVAPHSTTAFAFGTQSTKTTSSFYAMRRTGTHWSKVGIKATPTTTQLFSVAAGSPKSAWVVGDQVKTAADATLIEHSKGGSFKPEKTKIGAGQLTSVSASSASNAWAVGDGRTTPGPFIVRWNGHKWSVLKEPKLVGYSFDAVSTSSPKNVAMFGFGPKGDVAGFWNGHKLTIKAIPLPVGSSIGAIATSSAKSTWVVGTQSHGTTTVRELTFTEHWNGHKWKVVKAPSPGYQSIPRSVSAAGSRVYLAGSATPKAGTTFKPYALRYSHGKWKNVHVASRGRQSDFGSISVSSKGGAAVGTWSVRGQCVFPNPTPILPLAENLIGSSFHSVSVAKFRFAQAHLRMPSAVASVPGC